MSVSTHFLILSMPSKKVLHKGLWVIASLYSGLYNIIFRKLLLIKDDGIFILTGQSSEFFGKCFPLTDIFLVEE